MFICTWFYTWLLKIMAAFLCYSEPVDVLTHLICCELDCQILNAAAVSLEYF